MELDQLGIIWPGDDAGLFGQRDVLIRDSVDGVPDLLGSCVIPWNIGCHLDVLTPDLLGDCQKSLIGHRGILHSGDSEDAVLMQVDCRMSVDPKRWDPLVN